MTDEEHQLGSGHYYVKELDSNGTWVGIHEIHKNKNDQPCCGYVAFVGWEAWTVNSLDPLDINQSLLCGCGVHGYIRQGRWVEA